MAMAKPLWQVSLLKLTDDYARNGQLLAQRYEDGWILIQVVTFFAGNHQAIFHRQVDPLADFENKNGHSILKGPLNPPLESRVSRRSASR